ncbi:hypothetical protein KC323_g71 [Hortaea werneckii]|nr:hypothetical protein KC323_g71 [Hortaea werneckii]
MRPRFEGEDASPRGLLQHFLWSQVDVILRLGALGWFVQCVGGATCSRELGRMVLMEAAESAELAEESEEDPSYGMRGRLEVDPKRLYIASLTLTGAAGEKQPLRACLRQTSANPDGWFSTATIITAVDCVDMYVLCTPHATSVSYRRLALKSVESDEPTAFLLAAICQRKASG